MLSNVSHEAEPLPEEGTIREVTASLGLLELEATFRRFPAWPRVVRLEELLGRLLHGIARDAVRWRLFK